MNTGASPGDTSMAPELRVENLGSGELERRHQHALAQLFRNCYRDADLDYLDRSLGKLDRVAIAWERDIPVAFSIGAQRRLDLPRLPDQLVLMGGLTCVLPQYRRLGLSRELQRATVLADAVGPDVAALSAGRMAHPATARLARRGVGVVPVVGRRPNVWQQEVGTRIAQDYGTEEFNAETFVCRGKGKAIGWPDMELSVDAVEWEHFRHVDRANGDSLLVLWWINGEPPDGWDPPEVRNQS